MILTYILVGLIVAVVLALIAIHAPDSLILIGAAIGAGVSVGGAFLGCVVLGYSIYYGIPLWHWHELWRVMNA